MRPTQAVRSQARIFAGRLLRRLRWLLAALALAGCARPAETPNARPALWRATKGGAVVWLFGTIHLLPADLRWNAGPVARAIAESDTLVTEIPEDDPQRQAAAFLKLARADGLPPLTQRVPASERVLLAQASAASGVPAATLDRMTTWGAALALTAGAARSIGAGAAGAPEAVLAKAFAEKRRLAFETLDGQLAIFARLSEPEQRWLLVEAARGAGNAPAEYAKLLAAWRAGDPAAIERAFNAAFADAPELAETLVTRRNQAWADQIAARATRSGTMLVAVGAGHLVGDQGLPALLNAHGFRTARVQ